MIHFNYGKTHIFPGLDQAITTNKGADIKKYCEYCGNTSGLIDSYGMCISCGGNLSEVKTQQPHEILDYSLDYSGISGSNWHLEVLEKMK